MMSEKLEIHWAPLTNKFITWGSEISLYEVVSLRDGIVPTTRLSNTTGANLLATNSMHHYVKCVDIYPKSENDLLLAIGQGNGRVTLVTFAPSQYDSLGFPGKEFVPRHPRQCNAVAWNPLECNLIAAGLDKYRSDYSILLWDITKCPVTQDINGKLHVNTMASGLELAGPVGEFAISEVAHSLAWFNTSNKCIAAGMNLKNIKIVDFRDPHKAVNTTLTKAVHGVCIDPHDDKHLASYFENQIFIWDTRNFEKPIVTLSNSHKNLIKIGWCPTRHNLLASLQRESSVINLYDIQHTVVGTEEVEPSVLERVVTPGSPHNITSFSWHVNDENRLLAIALSGSVTDYTVFDRITLNWASNSNIVWTFGRKSMKCLNERSYIALDDISNKIKERALAGYGLKEEFWKNGELLDDDVLKNLWNWLHLSCKLVDDGILRGYNTRHPGVRSILKVDGNMNKSESISVSWADLGNINCHTSARLFKHDDRDKALQLCGWHFDRDVNSFTKFLDRLQKERAYARAAAIAVFNLRLKLAIEILNKGSENSFQGTNLNVVAMALSGFSDDKNSMWRQLCSSTRSQLNDPYLRAMFAFLTADNYNYDNVLNEEGMFVDDRVAFACIFLSDNKLQEYLKKLSTQLVEEGNLDGILLTGNNSDGAKLLQRYLDASGDIQSTAIIGVKAFSGDLFATAVREWVMSYRNLLDTWQLWNQRALFDIMLSPFRPADKPPQQVYVSCNFCGKSISAYMQGMNRGRGSFSRMGGTANQLKMSSCPNCRKPLPRCAICLMHMGTTTGLHNSTGVHSNEDGDNRLAEFSHWFTWCQSCRHGGHASHMVYWFKEHSECPVTPCTCRCFTVDSFSNEICT